MHQITKDQANYVYDNRLTDNFTQPQIAWFQINQELLSVDFSVFHDAVNSVLGRPVFTITLSKRHEELKQHLASLVSDEDKKFVDAFIQKVKGETDV